MGRVVSVECVRSVLLVCALEASRSMSVDEAIKTLLRCVDEELGR